MFYNLLFEVIKSLSTEEIELFKVFLKSPFFNTSNRIILLFNEIIKFYPDFNQPELTKELLFNSFSSKSFNESTLRNLVWKLSNLFDEFLLQIRMKNEKLESLNYILKEYNLRYIKNAFDFKAKKIEKGTADIELDKIDDYYGKYQFSLNNTNFHVIHDKIFSKKEVVEQQVKNLSNTGLLLFNAFITELINEYINIMSYHFNYDIDYKDNFIFDILKYINLKNIFKSIKNKSEYDYILELYLKLYECYCNIENDKFYYEYKNLFLENLNKLNEDSRAFHFGVLINLCLRKNNLDTSKDEFVNEEFNLYEIILQNEYYKEGKINYLPTYYFRAILFSALKLKKFDWVQNFIEKYSNNVPEEDRENIYNFGNAYLYFEKGEYNSSARHLLKISIDQFVFKFDIRNLTLKIFYELEDYDKAFEVLHSYKEFLRDSKLMTKDNKMLLLKYINYTEKFMLYKTGQRTIDIGRIKHNLQKEDKVAFKNWLIDKADELIQIGKKRVLAS